MKPDYLWDGSGEPDPEVQRLEALLVTLRHSRPAPVFPAVPSAPSAWKRFWQAGWFPKGAAVAATLLIVVGGALLFYRLSPVSTSTTGWTVKRLAGNPVIGSRAVGAGGQLGVGEMLETDSQSRARLSVEEVGEVEVEPGTRLRILAARSGHKRLGLDRGTIHASIWAPPGRFVVDTPAAVAVDLGCAYTLHVDDSGAGLLRTTLGWVGFKLEGHESFIPAGAACATRPKIGPGTPYFEDASEPFRTALSRFDFGADSTGQRADQLTVVLAESRKRDALTLWHLLARVDGPPRGRVYDRLAGLMPPPPGVTREGILRLDQKMLDSWWNQFGLGDVALWRNWERSWSEHGPRGN